MKIEIVSHGGIGNVDGTSLTGSCHELTAHFGNETFKILIDAWMFQGRNAPDRDTASILARATATFLTHPHADHIGDVPMAFMGSEPIPGPVFATTGTREAARVSWEDSAKIFAEIWNMRQRRSEAVTKEVAQALDCVRKREDGEKQVIRTASGDRLHQSNEPAPSEKYNRALRTLDHYGVKKDDPKWRDQFVPKKPPYDVEGAKKAYEYVTPYDLSDGWKEIVPGRISARLYDAGHIVGSSSVLLKIEGENGEKPKHVLFSGDIGSYKWDFHPCGVATPPNDIPLDVVVIESTYGRIVREPFEKGRAEFENTFERRCKNHDNVVLSCFSLDRFQNVLFRAIALKLEGKIDLPIYADSPSAVSYVKAYLRSAKKRLKELKAPESDAIRHTLGEDYLDREREYLTKFVEYLDPANGHYQTVEDEPAREFCKSEVSGKKIIVTTSGMANGGPVMGYLKSWVSNPKTAFFFPGYMAVGTTGRTIVDIVDESDKETMVPKNERFVKVEEASLLVRATIENPRFLSGHADAEDILTYLESLRLAKGQKIMIIHGETDGSSKDLKAFLEEYGYHPESLMIPELSETVTFEEDGVRRSVRNNATFWVPKQKKSPRYPHVTGKKPETGNGKTVVPAIVPMGNSEKDQLKADEENLNSIRAEASRTVREYEGAVRAISDEAFGNADTEYVAILLSGLRLQSELEELKAMRSKLENERVRAEHALGRTIHPQKGAKTPDRRKRQRHQNRQNEAESRISEYRAALGLLDAQIISTDAEIREKSAQIRKIFKGFSTSHQVSDFVKTGTLPVSEENGKARPSKTDRIRRAREKERGGLLWGLRSVEEEIARTKEGARRARENFDAADSEKKNLETILSHLPEHIESVAKSLRKRAGTLSMRPKNVKSDEDFAIWKNDPGRLKEIEGILGLAQSFEEKLRNPDPLIRTLASMGIVHSEEVFQAKRTELWRIRKKMSAFRNELEKSEEYLRTLRSDREVFERRLGEVERQLSISVDESTQEDEDENGSGTEVSSLVIMGGIRMAVEDLLSQIPEYGEVQRLMERASGLFRETLELSPGPDSKRIAEIKESLSGVWMRRNGELLGSLQAKARKVLRPSEG